MRRLVCTGVAAAMVVLLTVSAGPALATSNQDITIPPGEIADTRQNILKVIQPFAGGLVDIGIDFASSEVTRCYERIESMQNRKPMTDVCIALDVALAMWVQALYNERPKAYAREMKITPNEFGDAALTRALNHLQGDGLERQAALQRAIELGGIAYRDLLIEVNRILDRLDRQRDAKPR